MEFLMEYHLAGIVIGVATFLIIGIFHPLVLKANTISECGSGGFSS